MAKTTTLEFGPDHSDEELHDESSSVATAHSGDDISERSFDEDNDDDDSMSEARVDSNSTEYLSMSRFVMDDGTHESDSNLGIGKPDVRFAESSRAAKDLVDLSSSTVANGASLMDTRNTARLPTNGRLRQKPGRKPKKAGGHPKGARRLAKYQVGHPDEDVQGQPDVVFDDQSLAMPLDGAELRLIMKRIERDQTLCFKMRWYVARHLRRNFVKLRQPCYQSYALRIRSFYYANAKETNDQAQLKLYNRLDFEAARAQVGFKKDQPGWEQATSKVKMLQEAYEVFNWSEFVTDDDVDEILIGAKAHPGVFDDAARVNRSTYYSAFGSTSDQLIDKMTRESSHRIDLQLDHDTQKSSQMPEPSYKRSKRKWIHDDPPRTSQHYSDASAEQTLPHLYQEFKLLREEVTELRKAAQEERVFREKLLSLCAVDWGNERRFRETFLAEHRASQDALLAELRELREITRGDPKRHKIEKYRT